MKLVVICLFLCSSAYGQTVHIKDEKIVYEEKISTANMTSSEAIRKAHAALRDILNSDAAIVPNDTTVVATAAMKLQTPHRIIRIVNYTIQVRPTASGYQYRINNVSMIEKVRGEKSKKRSDKELLKALGESGKISIETEKLLNEIDMRFQEIIAGLKQKVNS
jgi:hypothetical protein